MALNFGRLFGPPLYKRPVDKIMSISGMEFHPGNPDVDDVIYLSLGLKMSANDIACVCPIQLPDGATILRAVVYASISDETWNLKRVDMIGAVTRLITPVNTNLNTSAAVDKQYQFVETNKYNYYFDTSSLDDNDYIYGAVIIYSIEETAL